VITRIIFDQLLIPNLVGIQNFSDERITEVIFESDRSTPLGCHRIWIAATDRFEAATMMHMTFYVGTQVTLWFGCWRTTGWLGYSFTLVALLALSLFHEWLATCRAALMKKNKRQTKRSTLPTSVIAPTNVTAIATDGQLLAINVAEILMNSILFGINVGAGYLLMLAVMTFNVGVGLTVVVGLSMGFFIFRSTSESTSRADMCGA
jgi:copper transporter 1